MKFLPSSVILAGLFFTQAHILTPVLAADLAVDKKTYDATYDLKDSTGTASTMRMGSNGKGLVLSSTIRSGSTTTVIYDYPHKVALTLIPASKMIMRLPLTTPQTNVSSAQIAQQQGAKPLGAKTVDGHPCHGFETTKQGVTTQTWIGDDIQHTVHSETNGPSVKSSMSLKSWSDKAPPTDAFKLPDGWKEMSMPGT